MTRDWQWFAMIAAYFFVGVILRLTVHGEALGLDEAEAYWFARNLQLGYNAQPPLYFWLQWMAFQFLGEGLLALALLKGLVLTTGMSLVYILFRRMLPAAGAGLALLSLALLPEISWEMQRALTHTALVFTMVAATLIMFLRVLERQNWRNYLFLGLVIGLGGLSKHNFHLVPIALLLVWLTIREARERLCSLGLMLSALSALTVMAPYMMWMWQNPASASGSLHKLGLDNGNALTLRIEGMESLMSSLVGLLAPALIVLVPIAYRQWHRLFQDLTLTQRLILHFVAISLVLFLALVLFLGVSNVRQRWMMPLLWPLVPLSVALIWPRASQGGKRALAWITTILWGAILIALPLNDSYNRADFAKMLEALPQGQPIGSSIWVLGNLAKLNPTRELFDTNQEDAPFTTAVLITVKGQAADVADRLGLKNHEAVAQPLILPDTKRHDRYEWLTATSGEVQKN